MNENSIRTKGLFLIIDRKNEKGLTHWIDELETRKIPAVLLIDEYLADEHPDLIKEISQKGFEICCSYNDSPFWDESYDSQMEIMTRIKDKWQSRLGESLRVFGSKYFAYTEDTLKIADQIGVKYIFARGTTGVRSVVYQPKEYQAKIVSVSNVPSKALGTGSLCDESLRCRNATPQDLQDILFNTKEDRISVVAQTHLSGVKLNWWNAYQSFLNANRVDWLPLNDFVADPIVLPNMEIPLNTRADYRIPMPKVPLEAEPDFPF